MNEELKGTLEVHEEESMVEAGLEETSAIAETIVTEEMEQSVIETAPEIEYNLGDNVHVEPVIEIEAEPQPEAVLEQSSDGVWRHTDDSPFSPFYVPDKKEKKGNGITIALVAVLLVFLVAGMIFAVSKLVEAAMGEASAAWDEGSGAIEGFFADLEKEFEEEADIEEENELNEFIDENEEYDDDYYEEDGFNYDDGIYQPTPEDDYYLELADAIRDDLSYSVDFVDYEVSDVEYNVDIWVQYVEVSDDMPFADEINEQLKDGAMYYAQQFDSMSAVDLQLTSLSYVTYMDEKTLSVVVDERYSYEDYVQYDLYCMNFDLTTGALLYNTEIIDADKKLAKAFRKQSEYQNGITSSVDDYTNEEIEEFLANEDSLILFYSPVGLEIGYNHPEGWVTATFKDYEEYLKKL